MSIKIEWEMIDGYHWRMRVPGGWIFKIMEDIVHKDEFCGYITGQDWRVAICFVPDPNHFWR